MEPTGQKIRALVQLLAEEEQTHVTIIRRKLIEYGELAVPHLMDALQNGEDVSVRVESILEEIRLGQLGREISSFAMEGETDLEKGAFLLARLKFPMARSHHYQPTLSRMSKTLRDRVLGLTDPHKIIETTRHYLFDEEGFCGNSWDYYDPNNSFINRVLDRRTGIPISLAVVVLLVTQRANIPFYGIGMPGHFLLQAGEGTDGILMDPFNNGKLLTREEVIRSFDTRGVPFKESYLTPIGNRDILTRIIRNLIPIYRSKKEEETVRCLVLYHTFLGQHFSST